MTLELPCDGAVSKAQPATPVPKRRKGPTSKETRGMPCHDFLKELVGRARQKMDDRFVLHVVYPTSAAPTAGRRPVMVVRYGETTTVQKFRDVTEVMCYNDGAVFPGSRAPTNDCNSAYWYWD